RLRVRRLDAEGDSAEAGGALLVREGLERVEAGDRRPARRGGRQGRERPGAGAVRPDLSWAEGERGGHLRRAVVQVDEKAHVRGLDDPLRVARGERALRPRGAVLGRPHGRAHPPRDPLRVRQRPATHRGDGPAGARGGGGEARPDAPGVHEAEARACAQRPPPRKNSSPPPVDPRNRSSVPSPSTSPSAGTESPWWVTSRNPSNSKIGSVRVPTFRCTCTPSASVPTRRSRSPSPSRSWRSGAARRPASMPAKSSVRSV